MLKTVYERVGFPFPELDPTQRHVFNSGQFLLRDPLSRCSRCKAAWYCSRDHQMWHFKMHHRTCRAIRGVKVTLFQAAADPTFQLPYLSDQSQRPSFAPPPLPEGNVALQERDSSSGAEAKSEDDAKTPLAAGPEGVVPPDTKPATKFVWNPDLLGPEADTSSSDYEGPIIPRQKIRKGTSHDYGMRASRVLRRLVLKNNEAKSKATVLDNNPSIASINDESSSSEERDDDDGNAPLPASLASDPAALKATRSSRLYKWRVKRKYAHYRGVEHERRLFESLYARIAGADLADFKLPPGIEKDSPDYIQLQQEYQKLLKNASKPSYEQLTYLIARPQCEFCLHRPVAPPEDNETKPPGLLTEDDFFRCPVCHITTFCKNHFKLGMRSHTRPRKSDPYGRSQCDHALAYVQVQQVLRDLMGVPLDGSNAKRPPPIWIPKIDERLHKRAAMILEESPDRFVFRYGMKQSSLECPYFEELTDWTHYWAKRGAPLTAYPALLAIFTQSLTLPITIMHMLSRPAVQPFLLQKRLDEGVAISASSTRDITFWGRNKLTLHILGATMTFELALLPKYEEILHMMPCLSLLELVFLGPEIMLTFPELVPFEVCNHCKARNAKLRVFFSPRLYHEFIADELAGRQRIETAKPKNKKPSTTPDDTYDDECLPGPVHAFEAPRLRTAIELGFRAPDALIAFNSGLHMFAKGAGSGQASTTPGSGEFQSPSNSDVSARLRGGMDAWDPTLRLIFPGKPVAPQAGVPQFNGLYEGPRRFAPILTSSQIGARPDSSALEERVTEADFNSISDPVPLFVTCYNRDEAILGAARVETYPASTFIVEPRLNPFASQIPEKETSRLLRSTFYYRNHYWFAALPNTAIVTTTVSQEAPTESRSWAERAQELPYYSLYEETI